MKIFFKIGLGMLMATAVTILAAPQHPFPQNMKHPYGTTIDYADTEMIKEHYNLWKDAWYDASQGYILAPDGSTCSTTSQAIAYGMLIAVYMDDGSNGAKDMFDRLYGTWKSNNGNGGGMSWQIGCNGGTGSTSAADFDAALALIMASEQWNDDSYLDDAKTIITWIGNNDINKGHVKPGNQWNDAFNPSYGALVNFKIFKSIDDTGPWASVISTTVYDLKACQNSSTGLVPDWCDWSSHEPTMTSASVVQTENVGFFDDAARTPWRMAWAYYWYGNTDAKAFNKKISDWLIPTTRTANGVNSGYYVDGKPELSTKRNFVSSTFSGGLGLATSSVESSEAQTYLGTVYKTLSSLKSCPSATGCGGEVAGEKFSSSTLNLLYLLLMTGNMPNFYDMTGFTAFTPDPTKAPSIDPEIEGTQMERGDKTVGVSGLWNWVAIHDKLGIGTRMVPDSGSSPLYKLNDGSIIAYASMEIGPDPEWSQAAADAGTLKYPSAGITVTFKDDKCKKDNSCGVNFNKLGVKAIRVTMTASGPIRMSILNEKTVEANAEPGVYVPTASNYVATTYDLTPYDQGVKGFDNDNFGGLLDWVDMNKAPEGSEIITAVTGFKWEIKDAQGGTGTISIKSIEFLDAANNVVDPSLLTGIKLSSSSSKSSASSSEDEDDSEDDDYSEDEFDSEEDDYSDEDCSSEDENCSEEDSDDSDEPDKTETIKGTRYASLAKVSVSGMNISVESTRINADVAVFSMQGKLIASGRSSFRNATIAVPNKGAFLVRVNGKFYKVNVK